MSPLGRLCRRSQSTILIALSVVACGGDVPTNTGSVEGSLSVTPGTGAKEGDHVGTDAFVAELARAVPGLNGIWYEGDRGAMQLTVQPGNSLSLSAAGIAVIERHKSGASVLNVPIEISTREGTTLAALLDLKLRARSLMTDPDIRSLGVDKREGVLHIGVGAEEAIARLTASIEKLGGTKEATRIVVENRPKPAIGLTDRRRPKIESGFQIVRAGGFECTHGFDVLLGSTYGFVTNSHCSPDGLVGTLIGHTVYQNSATFVDQVGVEIADRTPFSGAPCGSSPLVCRFSDAMVVGYFGGNALYSGKKVAEGTPVQTMFPGGLTYAGSRVGMGSLLTFQGWAVRKTGRTSGTTQGTVSQTCYDLPYPDIPNLWLLCQDLVFGAFSATGDSGSPVYNGFTGGNTNVFGILWGTYPGNLQYVYSPWSGIVLDLGVF